MCCMVKYGLFIANLVFVIAGLTLIGLGIAVLVQLTDLLEIIPVNINTIPITLIVIGAVIFLIAFFGCCGAIKENRCFLSMYALCLLLLAAGKIYLAVVVFGTLENLQDTVVEWLGRAFNDNNLRDPYHVVESVFKCCGTSGPDSYVGILPQLPASCCPNQDDTCDLVNAYRGCNGVIEGFFETYIQVIGSVIIVVIGVELAAVVFGMCLCTSIRR